MRAKLLGYRCLIKTWDSLARGACVNHVRAGLAGTPCLQERRPIQLACSEKRQLSLA